MNILVITNLFPNPLEPLRSTFNERQLTALANTSTLVVICPISWVTKFRYCVHGRLSKIQTCTTWNGIPVHYPTYFYFPKVFTWPRGIMMAASILWRSVCTSRSLRPNAILATWAFPDGFAAVLVGRLLRLPVVIKVHGSDVESLGVHGLTRRMALWALGKAAKVVSVSKYLKDRLVENGVPSHSVAVIYNGVDSELFCIKDKVDSRLELGLDLSRNIILFVGNLKFDKGIFDLLDALSYDACMRLNPLLLIIGDGPAKAGFEEQIKTRSLCENVRTLGRKNPAEIVTWMNAADCLCLPSHHEGIPNVVLESLSCGVPVLASRVGGIPEAITDENGALAPPQSPEELAAGLAHMFARTWDRQTIRRSCAAGTWAASAANLEHEIFASIG